MTILEAMMKIIVSLEMFVESLELNTISIHSQGKFDIFFFYGGLFAGHCIIVSGNINGSLEPAFKVIDELNKNLNLFIEMYDIPVKD